MSHAATIFVIFVFAAIFLLGGLMYFAGQMSDSPAEGENTEITGLFICLVSCLVMMVMSFHLAGML